MIAQGQPLLVQDVIDARPLGRFQCIAIGLCILVAVLDGFDTQTIGMLAPSIAVSLGVPVKAFGPALSAGLIGMLLGAVTLGPLADRYGRKTMIVFSCVLFGSLSLATAYVTTLEQLFVLRLLTGVGLGGALPNAISLASEYAPQRHARTTVTTLMCGMPLGAVLGGLVSAALLPRAGWHAVFIVGGVLPLAVAVLIALIMPESARFLTTRGRDLARLGQIMRRIAPELRGDEQFHAAEPARRANGVPIRLLFTEGRALATVLLWIPYFLNLVVLYFIVSWMPAVLIGVHLPASAGIAAISAFSVGGVLSSVIQGALMNWLGARRVLLCELIACAALMLVLGMWPEDFALVVAVSFGIGAVVQGAQAGFNALAAEIYPTHMRATGVGCAVGIGRIGSISGPVLGGVLLAANWSPGAIFMAGVVPALIAAVAVAANRSK
nr:MFS transporter [uncultured Cupriavidus sp.]